MEILRHNDVKNVKFSIADYNLLPINWEFFEIIKKISPHKRQIPVVWAKSDYFPVDSAVEII